MDIRNTEELFSGGKFPCLGLKSDNLFLIIRRENVFDQHMGGKEAFP